MPKVSEPTPRQTKNNGVKGEGAKGKMATSNRQQATSNRQASHEGRKDERAKGKMSTSNRSASHEEKIRYLCLSPFHTFAL
ncbi:MAG: hypothetical protein LBL13_08595 [Bacteroidales bacterium]|nr:hypothetical protein [Bacteroidales bacterium]